MAKRKCYPVPFGNVTICDNNKEGQCKLWNKKCDNIIEDKETAKEENSLAGWSNAIRDSAKQAKEQRKEWQKFMGDPQELLIIGEYEFGFWKSQCPEGVIVAPINKQGADPTRMQTYEKEFIETLVKTLEK